MDRRPPAIPRSLHRRRPAPTCAGIAGRRHDRFRALVCEAQMSPVRKTHRDAAIEEENRTIDRKANSICRGC
jgi:hypothetical protein